MRKQITNDIILRILQNTYLFRVDEVGMLLTELFFRYINTLDYINANLKYESPNLLLERLELARGMLYFIGYYFPEEFGRGAIERRLVAYSVTTLRFYEIIDRGGTFDYSYLTSEQKDYFQKIVKYYEMLKYWKNLVIPGYQLYLAEDYYNNTRQKLLEML